MTRFRWFLRPVAVLAVTLSGCVPPPGVYYAPPPRPVVVAPPPPIPSMLAAPGPGKSEAAFEDDDALCRRSAPQNPSGDNIYAQCMISHGNVIQATPLRYGPPYGYRRPYGYGWPPY